MKVAFIDWPCYGRQDVIDTFSLLNWEVSCFPFSTDTPRRNNEIEHRLTEHIKTNQCDFVFSFNYFPLVSTVCNQLGIKYVSWVYDSPHVSLYSCTVINPCNYIFLFDKSLYFEFREQGFSNIYYLPLAVNTERLQDLINSNLSTDISHEISFVGSLYIEPKQNLFDRMSSLSQTSKGYLDGLIMSQMQVWGYNFVEECLSEELIKEMHQAYPLDPHPDGVESHSYLYSQYVINRKITSIDRILGLETLGQITTVDLYTPMQQIGIEGCTNHGPIDYYKEMPVIFNRSKINFNSTLRSIQSGIPLRILDILGSNGFLITNFQADLFDYFVPDEDLIIFEDMKDLKNKAEYYLQHEEERKQIQKNGYTKVQKHFRFQDRIEEIIVTISP